MCCNKKNRNAQRYNAAAAFAPTASGVGVSVVAALAEPRRRGGCCGGRRRGWRWNRHNEQQQQPALPLNIGDVAVTDVRTMPQAITTPATIPASEKEVMVGDAKMAGHEAPPSYDEVQQQTQLLSKRD
jgi:hypothetical protein